MLDLHNLEVIILTGGKGTRLQSIVSDRPKPMAEVLGNPFLEWIILALKKQGIHKVILATSYLKEMIKDYFKDGQSLKINITYSEEPSPLDTGGAVLHALNKITGHNFIVMNGDSFCKWDLKDLLQTHLHYQSIATLSLVKMPDTARYGTVRIDKDHQVESFQEKDSTQKASGLINSGVYLFEKNCFIEAPFQGKFSIERDLLPFWINKNKVYSRIDETGIFLDIGVPEDYLQASALLEKEFKTLI